MLSMTIQYDLFTAEPAKDSGWIDSYTTRTYIQCRRDVYFSVNSDLSAIHRWIDIQKGEWIGQSFASCVKFIPELNQFYVVLTASCDSGD
jgi:hypothetical protein